MDVPSVSPVPHHKEKKPLLRRVLPTLLILTVLIALTGVILVAIVRNMGPCEYPSDIAARAQIMTISTAVKMYQIRNRTLPPTIDSLVMAPGNAALKQPFIEANGIVDPWGRQFVYKIPGKGGKPFKIYSLGLDGKDGTDDDIHPN